ncbi:MAG: hypothetical protein ACK56I_18920, partial [bacterium]
MPIVKRLRSARPFGGLYARAQQQAIAVAGRGGDRGRGPAAFPRDRDRLDVHLRDHDGRRRAAGEQGHG